MGKSKDQTIDELLQKAKSLSNLHQQTGIYGISQHTKEWNEVKPKMDAWQVQVRELEARLIRMQNGTDKKDPQILKAISRTFERTEVLFKSFYEKFKQPSPLQEIKNDKPKPPR